MSLSLTILRWVDDKRCRGGATRVVAVVSSGMWAVDDDDNGDGNSVRFVLVCFIVVPINESVDVVGGGGATNPKS